MHTAEIRRDLLELEQLRENIATEVARKHHWEQQEKLWARQANYQTTLAIVATVGSVVAVLGLLAGVFGWGGG